MSIKHVTELCNHNKVVLQMEKFSEDKTVVGVAGGGKKTHILARASL